MLSLSSLKWTSFKENQIEDLCFSQMMTCLASVSRKKTIMCILNNAWSSFVLKELFNSTKYKMR